MKMLTRQVIVSKTAEEVISILKSCAYYLPKAIFDESQFTMHCAKRHNGGRLFLTKIKGNISERENKTKVTLEIHADICFFLGAAIALGGLLGLLYSLVFCTEEWLVYIGLILFGLIVGAQLFWRGSEQLDLIEHKLTR